MNNIFAKYMLTDWRTDIILFIVRAFDNETNKQMLYKMLIEYTNKPMLDDERDELISYIYTSISYQIEEAGTSVSNILSMADSLELDDNKYKRDLLYSIKQTFAVNSE